MRIRLLGGLSFLVLFMLFEFIEQWVHIVMLFDQVVCEFSEPVEYAEGYCDEEQTQEEDCIHIIPHSVG